jgi:UDP-glucose 4-epimerase
MSLSFFEMTTHSIFIAGQDGFIGKRLTQLIRKKLPAAELNGSGGGDLNLTTDDAWKALSDRITDATHLIVLAGIKRQAGDAYDSFLSNIKIALSIARAIESAKPRRVLFFSSAAVYGEETTNISTAETTPVNPVSFYGIAKFASERILENAARNAGSSLLILRPPLIYGPEDTTDSYGPVGFIRSHLKGQKITLWGDGSELREFLFVEDCCLLVQMLLDLPQEGALNLASGKSHTFVDVISALESVSNSKVDFFTRPRTKGKADNGFDPSLLRSILPDFEFTSLEEGIRKTFEHESKQI